MILRGSKLALGTAKLGMPDYGFSDGNTLKNPIEFILKSLDLGLDFIDTSSIYGNSEELIGKALGLTSKKPFISTKIGGITPNNPKTPELMKNLVDNSLNLLNTDVDLCYLHQSEINIISDKYVHKGIDLLKDEGLIKEIGTSVYSKKELIYTLNSGIYDWVQIPVNVLDTSFYNLASAHNSDLKISVRSVFLQGVILEDKWIKSSIADHGNLVELLSKVRDICSSSDLTIQQLSIAYLASLEKVSQVIVGTTSIEKLKNNMSYMGIQLNEELISIINELSRESKSWTNPRYWT